MKKNELLKEEGSFEILFDLWKSISNLGLQVHTLGTCHVLDVTGVCLFT